MQTQIQSTINDFLSDPQTQRYLDEAHRHNSRDVMEKIIGLAVAMGYERGWQQATQKAFFEHVFCFLSRRELSHVSEQRECDSSDEVV